MSGGSRVGTLMGVRIAGVGSSVPDLVVRNEDLSPLGCDPQWIVQRSGIYQRRHCREGEATSDLAVEAARRCVANAGAELAEVDLLVVGTYTPDLLLPSTACLVQEQLGLRTPAMDLHAACASFVYGLVTAAQFIATGCSRRALAIGADCNSRVVNPKDVRTYPLFGDAAGAVLLAPGESDQGLEAFALGADGGGASVLCRTMGGTRMPYRPDPAMDGLHFLHMEGRPVFKWAVRVVCESVQEVLAQAGLTLDGIDLVILHQANIRIIDAAAGELGIPPAKLYNNLDRYGNTAAASVPLALDEACREGRVARGSRILMSGFGAGLVWGTAIFRW